MKKYSCILLCLLLLTACNSKKKNLSFYDSENVEVDSVEIETESGYFFDSDRVSVPFTEKNGVKFIEVKINRTIGVDMIIDSGCSGTLISVDEANYLYQKGVLVDEDVLGVASSQIADGSIVENMVVNLREVIIGGRIVCPDVKATVSANSGAPLLLGNEVLNRTASYTIDNENQVIEFKLK